MANSSAESSLPPATLPMRWAPAWVIACVAAWPAPGIAEALLSLGALVTVGTLLWRRFTGDGRTLLSVPAWALTCTLFLAYWLPQLVSAVDADDPGRAWGRVAAGLRYLPFMWLVATAVATDARSPDWAWSSRCGWATRWCRRWPAAVRCSGRWTR